MYHFQEAGYCLGLSFANSPLSALLWQHAGLKFQEGRFRSIKGLQ